MKQLTKEEQEQVMRLVEELSQEDSSIINEEYYIYTAKTFLQSLKPKIYVCKKQCGTIVYFTKSVLNHDFVFHENEAHRFDSVEQAQTFIDEYTDKDIILFVAIF
jgi:hypothetical protein